MNRKRMVWLNGKIMKLEEAKINVLSPTNQFGANVFEGIRCYWNAEKKQLYAFRLNDHFKRLQNSMKMFRMEKQIPIDTLTDNLIETVKANNYKEDIAVRQTVFIDGFGSWMSKGPIGMFIAPIKKQRLNYKNTYPIRCCITSWERISEKNMSPKIKVGANYINSRMAQMEALENGYESAIFLNNQGKVSEGPGSCLFIVREGKLITPPITASILESITRDTIIKIASEVLGIETIERSVDRSELYISDEAFLCGSAMEVTPIESVDGILVGDGKIGDVSSKVHKCYMDLVTGKIRKYDHWLTPIYKQNS